MITDAVVKKGELMNVNKRLLVVTSEYQRSASKKLVKNISKKWSWGAASVITVSQRDEVLYVVDGQHRVLASMEIDEITHLPCIIFKGLTIEQEAEIFCMSDTNRQNLSAVDKFNAHLISGNKVAMYVSERVKAHKFTVSTKGCNSFPCVNDAIKLASENKLRFERVLDISTRLFKHGKVIGMFFKGFTAIDKKLQITEEFKKRIMKIGLEELKTAIREASVYHGNRKANTIAEGIMKVVNKGIRNKFEFEA